MTPEGYPQFVIFLVLGLGVGLAFVRPYGAFLFSVLLLTAGHVTMFNQTRLAGLGPYLNLNDACVLVAMAALFFDRVAPRQSIRVPQVVPLMLCVLVIAAAQSLWKLGWTYETIRALRWGLEVPLAFFLGANLVTSQARARKLVGTLLAATLLAALQHLLFAAHIWHTKALNMETYYLMRTIGYWAGAMAPAFLLSALLWPRPVGLGRRVSWLAAGVLLLGTIFLSQTRSLWFATVAAAPCLLVLLNRGFRLGRLAKFALGICIVFLAFGWALQRALPGLDVPQILGMRIKYLVTKDPQFGSQTATRRRAFEMEMGQWLKGSLLAGRGLYFFQTIENAPEGDLDRIAFGHLGYVTYLAQLGLLGLVVYAVYLPLMTISSARFLWLSGGPPVLRYIGLLAAASMVCLSLMFVMSSHFLSLGYFAPAVLYGATWTLARSQNGPAWDSLAAAQPWEAYA